MSNKKKFWQEVKRKLTSRKLWLSLVSFVSGLIILCGGTQEESEKIGGAIMAGAAIIGYTIGEGLADNESKGDKK